MDVLDRIAAIQNGRENLLVEKNEHYLVPGSNFALIREDSMDELSNKGDSTENKEISDDHGKVQNLSKNIDDMENVENLADYNEGYGGIVGEEIDRVFGVPDNNIDLKEDLFGLGLDTSINESCSAEKVKTNFMFNKPNLKTEDLIQFWSPGIQKQIERKATPKSRFQPKRKSCFRKVDYSDCKRRNVPKKKESIGGRLLKKVQRLKKDDTTSRKTNRDLRVARRSVLEISKMKKLRKQTHENRLRNEKNMKLALQSGGYAPVRTTNVTKPKEFNFTICNRTKMHTMNTRSDAVIPFEKKLRKDSVQHHDFKNENTIPVPFKFSLSQTNSCDKENWQSMAQATLDFQSKTPTRFRLKPSEHDKTFLEKKTVLQKTVTMPVTPKLLTRGRSRRYKVDAVKEQEEKEIEKMLNYKFKATEFNPKIVEKQGMYGVKSIPASSTTELKPFDFKIEERIHNRTMAKDATLAPEDTSVLEKSKTTSSGNLKPTKVKPFSFEIKDKERFTKKEEKIKEQILAEKKMHEFQASLLPSFSPDPLPDVQTKKATKMKPFNISSGSLSYQSKLDITLKMEADEDKARRRFKAQPADVVKKQPFQPITGLIPPTKISNIKLNTDSRAEEREVQQYWKQQEEKLAEEERLELERQKKIAEEAEIRELRKNAVHKAKPIPSYKPLEIKKSDIPLTEPKTPNLEVKKRAVARSNVTRELSE